MKLALVWLSACLAGCAGLAPVTAPPATPPDLGLGPADTFRVDAPEPSLQDLRWWHRFDDPALAGWVERALQEAPAPAIAAERVRQARALLASARAAGAARLTAQAGVEWRLQREAGERLLAPSAALSLDLEPDIWGGYAQGERAAEAGVRRSFDLLQAARLDTAAVTAAAYIEWRAALADEALLASAVTLQREVLDVVRVRVQAGLAPVLDLERARTEVAATDAELAGARQRSARAAAALQVLAGARPGLLVPPPRSSELSHGAVPALDGAVPIVRPLDLQRLRPDLRAAEQALVAAAAQVGVAEAALRPRLRLPGSLVFGSVVSGGAFDLVTAALALVGEATLADGGARAADLDAARSRWREAGVTYRQALLRALQQVEDALAVRRGTTERLAARERASTAAAAAQAHARTLYDAGLAGFLDVADAQRSALANQRDALQARADAAQAVVALYAAMGLIDAADPSGADLAAGPVK